MVISVLIPLLTPVIAWGTATACYLFHKEQEVPPPPSFISANFAEICIYATSLLTGGIGVMLIGYGFLSYRDDKKIMVDNISSNNFLLTCRRREMANALHQITYLNSSLNLSLCDGNGVTALMYACQDGTMRRVAMELLTSKADPNLEDNEGCTAIMYACKYSVPSVVNKLLEAKAEINICNDQRRTPLIEMCNNKMMKDIALKLLQDNIITNVQVRDSDNRTALTYACGNNLPEIADHLLKLNVQVSSTELYGALTNKMYSVAVEIIKAGSDYIEAADDADIAVHRALSFNFSQHPKRFLFQLSDAKYLNPENRKRVMTLLLTCSSSAVLPHMPIELIEIILSYVFC